MVHAGIEHTIKVWEPTAAAAQPLPREAAAVMEDNRAARGRGADPLVMDMDVFARLLSRWGPLGGAPGGAPGHWAALQLSVCKPTVTALRAEQTARASSSFGEC